MKFYIVDAFTEKIFGGNPAGVVILPEGESFPPEDIMIKTAAELRYSETAFIKMLSKKEFQIRYFTPAAEVELCGHATIGSFKALLYSGMIEDNCRCICHTLAGDIQIWIKNAFVLMDMASPTRYATLCQEEELLRLYQIMGLDYRQQKAKGLTLLPQIISTGLPDIIMPVADQQDLNQISPDFSALAELSRQYQVVGVHAFSPGAKGDKEKITCHTRNFAPLYDIDEEAATGTSSGALTYYGYLHHFIRDGEECRFLQGEKMGRPSLIVTRLEVDCSADGCEEETEKTCWIQVGGSAAVLAEGEIHLL